VLEPGIRREELRTAIGAPAPRVFDDVVRELERRGVIRTAATVVASPEFRIMLAPAQRAAADTFLAAAREAPYSPPPPEAFGLPDRVIAALESMDEVVRVSEQIAYPTEVFDDIRARVIEKLDRDGTITLAEYRDLFDTSRKYAQPTLEALDERRVTRRKGDVRVRFRGQGATQ
jgi:selenocysteine-specific elongation factor